MRIMNYFLGAILVMGMVSCQKGIERPVTEGETPLGIIELMPGTYCGEFGAAAECPIDGQSIEDSDNNIEASITITDIGDNYFYFDSGDDNLFEPFRKDMSCTNCAHSIPDSDEYNGLVFNPAHDNGVRVFLGIRGEEKKEYFGFVGFMRESCD